MVYKERTDTHSLPAGRKKNHKNKKRRSGSRLLQILLALLLVIAVSLAAGALVIFYMGGSHYRGTLSDQVLSYQSRLEETAAEYGISDYVPCLLAIMQVESKGEGEDIMQSSESMGLTPNSLTPEDSLRQGCRYFSLLVERAGVLDCDMDSVIQAYNYGIAYLDFVAARGGVHSQALAEEYACSRSGGQRLSYYHPVAIRANGGWKYSYGNMFYVRLVRQYFD